MTTKFVLYNFTRKEVLKPSVNLTLLSRADYESVAREYSRITGELVRVYELVSRPVQDNILTSPHGNEYGYIAQVA